MNLKYKLEPENQMYRRIFFTRRPLGFDEYEDQEAVNNFFHYLEYCFTSIRICPDAPQRKIILTYYELKDKSIGNFFLDWGKKFLLHTDIRTLKAVTTARAIYTEVDSTGNILKRAYSLSRMIPIIMKQEEPASLYYPKDNEKGKKTTVLLDLTFDTIIDRSVDINAEAAQLLEQFKISENSDWMKCLDPIRRLDPLLIQIEERDD